MDKTLDRYLIYVQENMTPGRRRLQVTKMCAGLGELQVEVAKGLRVRADQWTMTLTVTPESHWHTGSRFVTV